MTSKAVHKKRLDTSKKEVKDQDLLSELHRIIFGVRGLNDAEIWNRIKEFAKQIHKYSKKLKRSQFSEAQKIKAVSDKYLSFYRDRNKNAENAKKIAIKLDDEFFSIIDEIEQKEKSDRNVSLGSLPDDLNKQLNELLDKANIPEKDRSGIQKMFMAKAFQAQQEIDQPELKTPKKAPEEWEPRKENPLDFIQRVYGEYIKAGVLTLEQLRKLDSKLVDAARTNAKYHKIDKSEILPPTRKMVHEQKERELFDSLGENLCKEIFQIMRNRERRQYRQKIFDESSLDRN